MKKPAKNTVDIDAGTLILIVSVSILLPLLLTGFISRRTGNYKISFYRYLRLTHPT